MPTSTIRETLDLALPLIRAQRLDDAADLLAGVARPLAATNPDDAASLLDMAANFLDGAGRPLDGLALLREAESLAPEQGRRSIARGKYALRNLGDVQEAETVVAAFGDRDIPPPVRHALLGLQARLRRFAGDPLGASVLIRKAAAVAVDCSLPSLEFDVFLLRDCGDLASTEEAKAALLTFSDALQAAAHREGVGPHREVTRFEARLAAG
jgi:hypothetical protein